MSLFDDDDLIYDDDLDDDIAGSDFSVIEDHEKLVEPPLMSFCHGHDEQEKLFLDLFEKDSLPHAMIFSGANGIGKSTMAFRLARFLLKHGKQASNQDSLFGGEDIKHDVSSLDVAADDPVFARIASGGHADFLYINRYYDPAKDKLDANLKVDALRKIAPFLRKTASEGGWRIVIVDDADTMNRNAQNAILKILEEPPANVLIILIAHRPGMLIPTIRSRTRFIQFSPLSRDIMSDLLNKGQEHTALSVAQLDILSALSEGSIGRALNFIERDGFESLSQILDHLDGAPNWDWVKIHQLSATLSSPSQDKQYRMFVELLQWVFRQMLFIKARGGEELPIFLQHEALENIMLHYSLEKLISITDGLKSHFERVEFSNLDRRDAVRAGFLVISQ
ncbi:MAG: ATPase [Zetaproteobacteria bacterium]|nr:MAG: ATPase [Zetaproteobacteria bacterium]